MLNCNYVTKLITYIIKKLFWKIKYYLKLLSAKTKDYRIVI